MHFAAKARFPYPTFVSRHLVEEYPAISA